MTSINVFGTAYIENNINVGENVNVGNYLRVYELLGVLKNIDIHNYGFFKEDLNFYKDIMDIKKPIIHIKKPDEDSFTIDNNLNCYYDSTFENLNAIKDSTFTLLDSYQGNLNIINTLNTQRIYNTVNLFNKDINKTTSSFARNLNTTHDAFMKDCTVFQINSNNFSTEKLTVLNNLNCDEYHLLTVKDTLKVKRFISVSNNINVHNSVIINGKMDRTHNSRFVLPQVNPNNNTTGINNGSLRYNKEKYTIEFFNNKWKSISSLESPNYNSRIIVQEDDNTNTANNITFYQNNNITIEFNNISNNLNIYKDNTIFHNNLNINGYISNISGNINTKNIIANNDVFIKNYATLNTNNYTNNTNGMIRFNKNLNVTQIFNNTNWGKLKFYSNNNGINVKDDIMDMYIKNNKTTFNSNTIHFHKNINIFANTNNTNNLTIQKNTTISEKIIFNNKAILQYENASLKAFIGPNYNTYDTSKYKLFDVNENYNNMFSLKYISNVFYSLVDYNTYSYALNDFILDNSIIINNNSSYIYISTENTNCTINSFEITYFINHSNIGTTDTFDDLTLIKQKYNIMIYSNNKLLYDSSSDIKHFFLKRNTIYTIQIKLKNGFPANNTEKLLLFIRLKGFYYTDLLFNTDSNIDFLYNIDANFRNEAHFSKNVDLLKHPTFKKSLITDNYTKNNLLINSNNFKVKENHIVSVKDSQFTDLFIIENNNIGIGTSILSKTNTITLKNNTNTDTLNVIGNSKIHKDVYVKNNIIIENNCTTNKLLYKNLNTNNVICTEDTSINQNINCNTLNSKNIILDKNTLIDKSIINNLYFNNKTYHLSEFINNNINISPNSIHYINTLKFDNNCNISIRSNKLFNAFSIGDEIKPNLSISHNGYTELNCDVSGFLLDNINILNEIDKLNTF